jgi:copper chaperone CopZ
MSHVTFSVPKIHCGHCVHTIESELAEVPGVRQVQAAQDTRLVRVEFEAPATQAQLETKLKEIEYPPEPSLGLS